MNKKAEFIVGHLFLIIIFLLLIGGFLFINLRVIPIGENDCLKEIAENYCEEKGLFYDDHQWGFGNIIFYCVEDERSFDYIEYRFTDEEVEECLGR